ncbi:MAG TPA: alpha/beta hydrolase [Alphaproteobacteria bacterium]|nr:alpha/beta hydrolase [Alphaproteobacteria bacterium]
MPEVIIPGPSGRIEGRYHHNDDASSPVALVLHPHPKHGGTMNNKVTYNLYKAFAVNGFSVLRFNFRGVGRSEGEFDNGFGELTDAAACLDWLQKINPDAATFWISGFSFGSWIALQLLMRRPEIEGFVTVSPPANMHDFSFLSPCPCNGLVVQGTEDSIVEEASVRKFTDRLNSQKDVEIDYRVMKGADHFFRDMQDELLDHLSQYIKIYSEPLKRRGRIKLDKKRRQLPKTS